MEKSCSSPSTISSTHAQSFVVILQPIAQDFAKHSQGELIVDSGSSTYMTHSSSHLENYKSMSLIVHIGDDSSLPVVGFDDFSIGDASLKDI